MEAVHLASNEVGDELAVDGFYGIGVEAFGLCPAAPFGEHCVLAFGSADAWGVGLEAGGSLDVAGAAADEAYDLSVEGVYCRADLFEAGAVRWRSHAGLAERIVESPARIGASGSALRER